jgi:Antibiotic biosynthesis monooxygenase
MRATVVRYTVKSGLEEENAALVRAVYEELARVQPEGFDYRTFRLNDGRTFVHVAEWEEGEAPLSSLPSFRAFRAGLPERCESDLDVRPAEHVGQYRRDVRGD